MKQRRSVASGGRDGGRELYRPAWGERAKATRAGAGGEDARRRVTDGGWRPRSRTAGLAAH
jgi:hypothetical protein